jgi:hypothetical protein
MEDAAPEVDNDYRYEDYTSRKPGPQTARCLRRTITMRALARSAHPDGAMVPLSRILDAGVRISVGASHYQSRMPAVQCALAE